LKVGTVSSLDIEEIISVSNSKVVHADMEVSSINGLEPRHGNGSNFGIVQLYPNPAKEQLNIVVNAPVNDEFTCVFYSASGQIVFEHRQHVFKGINTINIDLMAKQLNWRPGYYIVRMEGSQWIDVKPFVIRQ
jgi:hypothetical protein